MPFVGAFLINYLLKYKPLKGSRPTKEPSWKRLVKYEEMVLVNYLANQSPYPSSPRGNIYCFKRIDLDYFLI